MKKFEIYSKKEKGENCWSWRLKIEGKEVACCNEFLSKEANRDSIKQIQTQKRSLKDLQVDIIGDIELSDEDLWEATVVYECPEDDPAYIEKHDDTTQTRGIAGSNNR